MIFKPAIDNSLPQVLKVVDEQALRETAKLDNLQDLYYLFNKLFPSYNIYKELSLTYIIKMPNNSQAYSHLFPLCFHTRQGSAYILVNGSIERWCEYVINVLTETFDEALTLGYYMQVNQIYNELYIMAPNKFVRYHKQTIINEIFVLIGRN